MNVAEVFQKNIYRNINGVIKVGQQDNNNIRQELEEYVVTYELNKHFNTFFDRYTSALSNPTDRMGVWISGFFGSGKSHFLKILSYLLANRQLGSSCALDYFDENRIPDPMLLAKIAQAARSSCDVILFKANAQRVSSSIHPNNWDFLLQLLDLQGAGTPEESGLALFVSLCSASLKRSVQTQLAIFGEMTLGGTINPVNNLTASLQVAFDAGAKRVLLPMASAVDLASVPPELFAKFQTSFYADPVDAVFKALAVD